MHFGGDDYKHYNTTPTSPSAEKKSQQLKTRKSQGILGVPSEDMMRRKSHLDLSESKKISEELVAKRNSTFKIKVGGSSNNTTPVQSPLILDYHKDQYENQYVDQYESNLAPEI